MCNLVNDAPKELNSTNNTLPNKFPGLNGLRFIAACLVINSHSRIINSFYGSYAPNPIWNFFFLNASHAVTFFFVLSGFLITYLLLHESTQTGTIHIWHFYLKRLLRIFPLYYLVVLSTAIVLPFVFTKSDHYFSTYLPEQILLYFLFLPNVAGMTGKLSHLWSIGVEEQFYLLWGPLVKYFKRWLPIISIAIILAKWFIDAFVHLPTISYGEASLTAFMVNFVSSFHINYMAVGALGAWAYLNRNSWLTNKVVLSRLTQILVYGLLIIRFGLCSSSLIEKNSWLNLLVNPHFDSLVLPFIFLYILLNVSLNPKSFLKTHGKVWDYLGDLSFGIYMYHLPIIYLFKPLWFNLMTGKEFDYQYFYYVLCLYGVTISVSAISFKYFEKWFRRFRPRA